MREKGSEREVGGGASDVTPLHTNSVRVNNTRWRAVIGPR